MRWWCAATNEPWSWTWKPYIGVWIIVGLVLTLYLRAVRGAGAAAPDAKARRWFYGGLFSFWLALDWPVGALAGGYLVAMHTAQYIILTCVTAPLLLLGLRAFVRPSGATRFLANPLIGFVGYTVLMGATHLPQLSDALMASQLGSFVVDMAWLAGGGFLWWPVLAPEGIQRMNPLGQIGYLFVQTIAPTVPAAFLTFADFPQYRLYELAPRVHPYFTAAQDQQLAGLTMKLIADPFLWLAMGIIFFRWYREESKADEVPATT